MDSYILDDATKQLLREKGLKCICQLCDCGRPHQHAGCRLILQNAAFSTTHGTHKMETNYQSRFRAIDVTERRQPILPLEKPRDPNPPPMDFRTENKTAFQALDNAEKVKPCKLKGELEKLISGEFKGKSIYNESYIGYQPKQAELLRPQTVFKSVGSTFSSETEYSKGFPKKEKIHQESFQEKPANTYRLLYPDSAPVAKSSLKNSIHNGVIGEKAKTCKAKKSNVTFDDGYNVGLVTTNNEMFKRYSEYEPISSMKPKQNILPRTKFTAVSQNTVDYAFDETEAANAKAKLCPEYPSTVKLSMDAPDDFNTTASMSYNKWKPQDFTRQAPNPAKPSGRYTPPKEKFDGVSQSHADFVSFSARARTEMIKPSKFRKSSAKISGDSSYKTQFPNHGKIERKLYGDQHDDNLHLPPKSEKLQRVTVMQGDFKKQNTVKQTSHKPTYNLQNLTGKFQDETEYNQTFQPRDMKVCTFTKFITDAQTRRNERFNIGTV